MGWEFRLVEMSSVETLYIICNQKQLLYLPVVANQSFITLDISKFNKSTSLTIKRM